jgi:hypothetical protein
LLGLSGAYLLRALSESALVSMGIGVAIGILYAMMWLVWAARTPAARRLEAALDGLTSVLILAPLVFEAVTRFHAISTWTAAILLLVFTLVGLIVSWQKELLIVATFAILAGLGTSGALLIATYDVIPFTYTFLAISMVVEVSACLNHWPSERWLAAAAADLVVLLATWLVTNDRGLPEAYLPISRGALLSAQICLLVIYLLSTIVRTLLRRFTFTRFETAQCALAFVISIGGGLRLAGADPRLGIALGMLSLVCAAACYVISFGVLDAGTHRRNFYTYSTFGILLALAGTEILLPRLPAAGVWGVLAISCVWAGGFFGRLTLQVHGGIYLLAGLAASGALDQAAGLLLGSRPWPIEPGWPIWGGFAVSAICYGVGHYLHPWLRVAVAGVLVCAGGAIAAGLLTWFYHDLFGDTATHAYCATLRTGVLSVGALLLAWGGSRWKRLELSRLIYPVMLLGAGRVVMIDLHQNRTAALFLSLLLYGGALMMLPRISKAAIARD